MPIRNALAQDEPKFGAIEVASGPGAARVYIEGFLAGETPVKVDPVVLGPYRLVIKGDSYDDFVQDVHGGGCAMKRGTLVWFVAMLSLLPWECIAQSAESVARHPGPNLSSYLSPRFSRDNADALAQLGASPDPLLKAQLAPTQAVPSAQTGRRKFRTSWPMVIGGGVLMFFGAGLIAASGETAEVSLSDPFTGKPLLNLRSDRNNRMLGAGIGMVGGGAVLLILGLRR